MQQQKPTESLQFAATQNISHIEKERFNNTLEVIGDSQNIMGQTFPSRFSNHEKTDTSRLLTQDEPSILG